VSLDGQTTQNAGVLHAFPSGYFRHAKQRRFRAGRNEEHAAPAQAMRFGAAFQGYGRSALSRRIQRASALKGSALLPYRRTHGCVTVQQRPSLRQACPKSLERVQARAVARTAYNMTFPAIRAERVSPRSSTEASQGAPPSHSALRPYRRSLDHVTAQQRPSLHDGLDTVPRTAYDMTFPTIRAERSTRRSTPALSARIVGP